MEQEEQVNLEEFQEIFLENTLQKQLKNILDDSDVSVSSVGSEDQQLDNQESQAMLQMLQIQEEERNRYIL